MSVIKQCNVCIKHNLRQIYRVHPDEKKPLPIKNFPQGLGVLAPHVHRPYQQRIVQRGDHSFLRDDYMDPIYKMKITYIIPEDRQLFVPSDKWLKIAGKGYIDASSYSQTVKGTILTRRDVYHNEFGPRIPTERELKHFEGGAYRIVPSMMRKEKLDKLIGSF